MYDIANKFCFQELTILHGYLLGPNYIVHENSVLILTKQVGVKRAHSLDYVAKGRRM